MSSVNVTHRGLEGRTLALLSGHFYGLPTIRPCSDQGEDALRLLSGCQILVGDPLPNYCVHKTIQSLQRVTLHVAVVQPEGELIHVPRHVFRAGPMVDTIEPAPQDRAEAPSVV